MSAVAEVTDMAIEGSWTLKHLHRLGCYCFVEVLLYHSERITSYRAFRYERRLILEIQHLGPINSLEKLMIFYGLSTSSFRTAKSLCWTFMSEASQKRCQSRTEVIFDR